MASLNLDNIQGDILYVCDHVIQIEPCWAYGSLGIPKKFETSFFFTVEDVQTFRKQLTNVIPFITTSTQAQEKRSAISEHKRLAFEQGNEAGLVPSVGVTLAFSALGLTKVWIIIFVAQVTY